MRLAAAGLLAAALLGAANQSVSAAAVKSKDKRFTFSDSLPAFQPAPGRALLCLVREQRVRILGMPPERLYLDGEPFGYLAQLSYVLSDVAPGMHRLAGVLGAPPLVIPCEAGQVYLLRLREVIGQDDQIRNRWILDDPSSAREIVTGSALSRSLLTPRGALELGKKAHTLVSPGPADSLVVAADSAGHVLAENIWFEHPLDPLNLRRDFSIYAGQLELRPDVLAYSQQKKRGDLNVEISYARMIQVRYGGTRAVGVSPWIDVFYRGDANSTWRASFADAGTENPEASYNRIFLLVEARRRAAARDSAAGSGAATR